MKFILNIFKGVFIGAGAILPGISSGVLCVILGIYEELISRVLHFFKNFKENVLFFLPLIIGTGISIIFISKILLFLLENYSIPTSYCFIGLILGCVPAVFKYANHTSNYEKNNIFLKYLFLVFTFCFSIYLIALEYKTNTLNELNTNTSFIELFKSGFLMSAGVVIPGISNTVILMLLGTYNLYLGALSSLNLNILIPMGIGLLVGGFLFLKIIEFLFLKFKTYTYYGIIGFTLGSIFVLFPGFNFNLISFISIMIMIISFFISYKLSSFEKN